MGILFVSVTIFRKSKVASIQLSSLGITQKDNNKMTQLKYIGYCVWIIYKFWNK